MRLGALVARHFAVADSTKATFPGGAARIAGSTAWVYVDEDTTRSLGHSMAWARQRNLDEVHLIVEQDAGLLAHRAEQFATPPAVWELHSTELRAAEAQAPDRPETAAADSQLAGLLIDAGLDVVAEHGRLAGELRGLEVARVTGGRLEVGVGEADRELTAMVHGDLAPEEALERVVAIVDEKRRPGAARHPLNQLVPERWLRWTMRNQPGRVGFEHIEPAPSPRPRRGMRERDIAVATADGTVLVFSVGIDLDLVPAAAEARAAIDPDARLLLVIPERDDHPVTRALASTLAQPAEVVTVASDWRT